MNPWNAFVKRHKGSGLSMKELSAKYQREKGNLLRADVGDLDAKINEMEKMALRAQKSAANDREVDELRRRLKQCEEKLAAKRCPVIAPARRSTAKSTRDTTWSSR